MPTTSSAKILLDHLVRVDEVLYLTGAPSDGYTEQFCDFAESLSNETGSA